MTFMQLCLKKCVSEYCQTFYTEEARFFAVSLFGEMANWADESAVHAINRRLQMAERCGCCQGTAQIYVRVILGKFYNHEPV